MSLGPTAAGADVPLPGDGTGRRSVPDARVSPSSLLDKHEHGLSLHAQERGEEKL